MATLREDGIEKILRKTSTTDAESGIGHEEGSPILMKKPTTTSRTKSKPDPEQPKDAEPGNLERRIRRHIVGRSFSVEVLHAKGIDSECMEEVVTLLGDRPHTKSRENMAPSFARAGIVIPEMNLRSMIDLTYRLRTAREILWCLAEKARAGSHAEFEKALRKIPMELLFAPGTRIHVRVNSLGSRLYHEGMLGELAEKVLTDEGFTVGGDDDTADQIIDLRLEKNRLRVGLSLAGRPLTERGWKKELIAIAPLREDLAAVLLRWLVNLPLWKGVDSEMLHISVPFAGSGTLALEALAHLLDVTGAASPRRFAVESLVCAPEATIAHLRKKALEPGAGPARKVSVWLNDVDGAQLTAAVTNVEHLAKLIAPRAEVSVASNVGDFLSSSGQPNHPAIATAVELLLLNPPYGDRLGQRDDAPGIYQALAKLITTRAGKHRVVGFCLCPSGEILAAMRKTLSAAKLKTSSRSLLHGGKTVEVLAFARV